MSAVRLLLDEDVNPLLAEALAVRGYDSVAAVAAGLGGRDDGQLLEWATREGRAVLTHNVGDFVVLVGEYARKGWEHAGVIVCDQIEFRELLARTLRLLGRKSAEEMRNALEWLQNYAR